MAQNELKACQPTETKVKSKKKIKKNFSKFSKIENYYLVQI